MMDKGMKLKYSAILCWKHIKELNPEYFREIASFLDIEADGGDDPAAVVYELGLDAIKSVDLKRSVKKLRVAEEALSKL